MKRLCACLLGLVIALLPTAGSATTWPLHPEPQVIHDFDPPLSLWGAGHRGVDLAGRPGQPVLAAAAGQVTHAASIAGRGTVTVTHGAVRTTYEPVTSVVRVGEEVAEGQLLGHLQSFGSHCFPRACLHWGAIRGETYLDPLVLVGAGPVRLMPLGGNSTSSDRIVPPALNPTFFTPWGGRVDRPTGVVRW